MPNLLIFRLAWSSHMRPLTILFMPESAYGPTNNCIGIGDVLRRRGHRVVFAAEASWQGKLEPLGFSEDLVNLTEPGGAGLAGEADGAEQDAGQFWKDFIAGTAAEFRKPTIEQLDTWVRPVWEELIAGARYSHDHLTDIVRRTAPDVIVEDNVVGFPALTTSAAPFVRIVSCNPLELKGPDVPPAFSGYPAAERDGWAEFGDEYDVAGPGVHRRRRHEPVRLSADRRLCQDRAAWSVLAPDRFVGAADRRRVHPAAGAGRPWRSADLLLTRVTRLG